MNLKTLLNKIFGLKGSDYTLTKEETNIIEKEKLLSEDSTAVDVDAIKIDIDDLANNNEDSSYQELINSIYLEAKSTSDLEDYNLWAVDFNALASYKNLKARSRQEQKEFILFILNNIIDQENNSGSITKIPTRLIFEIINKLLRFQLSFKENEIWFLMAFCNGDHGTFGHWLSIKLVINKLKKYASKKRLSKGFIRFLRSFLSSSALNSTSFDSYTAQIGIIQRVLQNNAGYYKQNNAPLYLLIPDHFGNFVNKKIVVLETAQKEALSELVHKFSDYPNTDSSESYYSMIKFLVPIIGQQELKSYCTTFVERAAFFKPKVRTVYSRTDYRGNFYYYQYEPISKENLTVLRGFVFLVAYFKLKTCLVLLHKLIERSYSKADGFALGNGHKLVGESCIHILMHYFEDKGRKILLELYQETKLKSIKSRIKKEAKTLKINTDISFIEK